MSKLTEKDFWSILQDIPEPSPVFYRLYYKDDGTPIIYSMEDLPGNYIEVDQQTYVVATFNVQVVNKQLIFKQPVTTVNKLQPTNFGTACDPRDICIVVSAEQPNCKWTIVNNEIN